MAGPFLRRRFLAFARRTTRDVLESLTANQRLIGILTTQWGDYGYMEVTPTGVRLRKKSLQEHERRKEARASQKA